jgi:hypothetical protein
MSQFTKVNGDLLPVINYDAPQYTNSGANAIADNVPVQPQGPKLDYFRVNADGAFTGTQVNLIIQATQQLATVYIYEYYANGGGNDQINMAVYPARAWTDSTLQTAIRAELTAGNVANAVTVDNYASFGNLYC